MEVISGALHGQTKLRRWPVVRQALEEGAVGLSAGLEYTPGRWSTTDEVAALAAELAPYDGVYISHERAEGADPMWYLPSQHEGRPPTLQDAVMETIEIGRRTGVRVVASHIKAKGVAIGRRAAPRSAHPCAPATRSARVADRTPTPPAARTETVLVPSGRWRSDASRPGTGALPPTCWR